MPMMASFEAPSRSAQLSRVRPREAYMPGTSVPPPSEAEGGDEGAGGGGAHCGERYAARAQPERQHERDVERGVHEDGRGGYF